MYKIIVLETVDELFDALSPQAWDSKESPALGTDKISIEIDYNGIHLHCNDDRFNVDKISGIDVVKKALEVKHINLTVTTERAG